MKKKKKKAKQLTMGRKVEGFFEPLSRHLFKAQESSSLLVIGSSTGRQCRRCTLQLAFVIVFGERAIVIEFSHFLK